MKSARICSNKMISITKSLAPGSQAMMQHGALSAPASDHVVFSTPLKEFWIPRQTPMAICVWQEKQETALQSL